MEGAAKGAGARIDGARDSPVHANGLGNMSRVRSLSPPPTWGAIRKSGAMVSLNDSPFSHFPRLRSPPLPRAA
jgi:hypothetical protein